MLRARCGIYRSCVQWRECSRRGMRYTRREMGVPRTYLSFEGVAPTVLGRERPTVVVAYQGYVSSDERDAHWVSGENGRCEWGPQEATRARGYAGRNDTACAVSFENERVETRSTE